MRFSKTGLTPIGGQSKFGKAPQRFAYKTDDALATVAASGYFNTVAHMLAAGDVIDVVVVDSMTTTTQVIATGSLLVAASVSGVVSAVDISTGPYTGGLIRMPFYFNETDLLAPTSQQILSPVAGTLKRLVTVVKKQVTTGGVIGASLAGTAVAGLTVTVADAATVGTVGSSTPTSVTRLTADQAIAITAGAPFATAGEVFGYVEIIPDVDTGDIYVPFFFNQTDLLAGTSQWVPSPAAGQIIKQACVTQVAVTTGGDLGVKLATVAVVGLTTTVPDASAVGAVVTDAPTSLTGATGAVTNEQAIEVTASAPFATAGAVNGYITIRPTVKTKSAFLWFFANQTDVLAGTSHYRVSPINGRISRMAVAEQIAVTTGGNVMAKVGTSTVLGLTVVVANGGAAGDVKRDDATAGDTTLNVVDGTAVEVVFDPAFATAGALNGFIEVVPA